MTRAFRALVARIAQLLNCLTSELHLRGSRELEEEGFGNKPNFPIVCASVCVYLFGLLATNEATNA